MAIEQDLPIGHPHATPFSDVDSNIENPHPSYSYSEVLASLGLSTDASSEEIRIRLEELKNKEGSEQAETPKKAGDYSN